MKKYQLKINNNLLVNIAKERFAKISNQEEKWDEIYNKIKDKLDPKCEYVIFNDIKIDGNNMSIGDQVISAEYFSTIPKEIIGDAAVSLLTIGDITVLEDSVLNNTLIDMVLTAFVDALRELLRMELQEDYIVSGSIAPGLEGMNIEEIIKFAKLIDFDSLGIKLNDSLVMIPEKSVVGLYLFFNEEHPISTNSCSTCMARGYGCNFCSVEGENDV